MLKNFLISKKEYIILFFITILVCLPFLTSSQYIEGNDTHYHISNIYSIYTKMCDGDLGLNKVFPIIANNYGYGSGIFYPQLSHIVPAGLTYILQGNIILAVKITHLIVYYISAIMMYKLVNRVFKNKYVALISAIFYITAPYAIADVFTRDAMAESFVFMFIPMIVLGLYELFEGSKRSFYIWFIIGYLGMISSHLVMSVYFTAFVFIYLLINIKKVFKANIFRSLVLSSVIILLITLPFTSSLIEHNFIGEYYVFEGTTMTDAGLLRSATFFPWEFLIQHSNERYPSIKQYQNLLAVALAVLMIVKRKSIIKDDAEKKFYKMLWIFVVLALFMMTACPWEIMPKFMLMLQFAWRIETMLIFALSILAGLALRNLNTRKAKAICLGIIVIFNMFTISYSYMPEMFIDYDINNVDMSYYGMGWEKEYLPVRTTKNLDYFYNRGNEVIIRRGNAEIEKINDNTPDLDFKVTNNNESIVVELPRIYYIGYNISFTDENNETKELQFYMNENGFIDTRVIGNGIVKVTYTGSAIEKVANKISLATIIVIAIYIVVDRIKYIMFKNKNIDKMKLLSEGEK